MTRADGQCRIDGIAVGEATLNLLGATPVLIAKYGLCNTTTGDRFGAGNRNLWSEATMEKLTELIASMELDIARDLFGEGSTSNSAEPAQGNATDGVPGL